MEEYNKYKDYPIDTIVTTKYGKGIIKESPNRNCGNHTCIFNNARRYCGRCMSNERKDKKFIYFKFLKEENMEKRNIQIDLETARKWYKHGDFPKRLALQAFTKEELEESRLPKSWEDYENKCFDEELKLGLTKHQTNIHILHRLLILRDVYRQGWKPNFYGETINWCLQYYENNIIVGGFGCANHIFSFPTRELATQFLANFKEDLEQLKELL